MSRDLNLLVPEFREKAKELLALCEKSGYPMRPFYTLRSPLEQAKLWRQSRSAHQVRVKMQKLRTAGAHYLADCISQAGPQAGLWATNAIPGLSWHQWGEALDCYWAIDGRAEWTSRKGYQVYADHAQKLGLVAGGHWTAQDWPHVQLRDEASPANNHTLLEINAEMMKRFAV